MAKKTTKTTVTADERRELKKLLEEAEGERQAYFAVAEEIGREIETLLDRPGDMERLGHIGDAIWIGGHTADSLLRKLGMCGSRKLKEGKR